MPSWCPRIEILGVDKRIFARRPLVQSDRDLNFDPFAYYFQHYLVLGLESIELAKKTRRGGHWEPIYRNDNVTSNR